MIPVIPTTQENHSTVPATVSGEEMKQPTEQPFSQPSPAGISHGAKLVGILFLIFVAVAIFWGILSRASAASRLETHTDENAALPVKVMTPGTSTGTTQIQLPGNTQAFNDTAIYARTSGYLKRWYADIGTHVKNGQLLADIETPEVDRQLDQARADLKSAESNAKIAGITAERWQNLLQKNAVSKQETDQAQSDLSSRNATVDSMLANVHRLEQLQSYEKVYAPFDGVITARNTDIGALINAGANGAPQELFHIAAVTRLRVFVAVPEVDSAAARTGAKAYLTLEEYPGEKFVGTIVRNSNAIDTASRTLNVEIDIDNRDSRVRPGAYVVVHIDMPPPTELAKKQSFVIPSNALLFRAEGLRVALAENGHAQLRPVSIGRDFGATIEVTSGIAPGDQIILSPSDSLTSGQTIRTSSVEKQ